MPRELKASRIILFVANPREVADFYVGKLGLKEREANARDTFSNRP